MRSLHPWPTFPTDLDPPIARSLSLQFVLQEVLASFGVLQDLRYTTPLQLQGANIKEELMCITKELEKFLLFSIENPMGQKSSPLDKLCFYCEILLQASPISGYEILVTLEEMRNAMLRTKSRLFSWRKLTPLVSLEEILLHLIELYSFLHQKLSQFFSSLIPFLKDSRTDENVLFFLIENKEKFNDYLGEKRIEELLSSFFPSGSDQMRAVIIEGYTRRGFTHFLAKIEPLIESIEWEATECHPVPTH